MSPDTLTVDGYTAMVEAARQHERAGLTSEAIARHETIDDLNEAARVDQMERRCRVTPLPT